MHPIAIFDCDGTIVDGQASICRAMDAAFAAAGLPAPDKHQVRRMVGLSLPQAIQRLAPEAGSDTVARAVEAYKQAFRAAREAGELSQTLFDGIAEVVDKLDAAGWHLGIATGMSRRGLDHLLAAHELSPYFATLQTADDHPSKPHPAMLKAALSELAGDAVDAVMIGDTVFDIQMAQDAGVRAIGVDWGYHDAHELVSAGAEFVAVSPAQLAEYLLS
jgi:phosphoglycolate phosphatase